MNRDLDRKDGIQCMSGADWGERAPSRRLVLEDDLQSVVHERDALASAIGNALVGAGIVNPNLPLTGPELIAALGDLVDHYKVLAGTGSAHSTVAENAQ
ncbi:hypothetical protein [Pseudomonas baetica]|uniref:hypothetical protein n=1 Tax=Pseudomonas baetica TaxID=674054 RepID=UPI002405A103|nr:hypothetical protein [Pseudomonas baetica]MDF9778979.1 hypothetical protein [Pseudomonas baetica]